MKYIIKYRQFPIGTNIGRLLILNKNPSYIVNMTNPTLRPINITSPIFKIFEKIIFNYLKIEI